MILETRAEKFGISNTMHTSSINIRKIVPPSFVTQPYQRTILVMYIYFLGCVLLKSLYHILIPGNWGLHTRGATPVMYTSTNTLSIYIVLTRPVPLKSNVEFECLSGKNFFHRQPPIHPNQLPLLSGTHESETLQGGSHHSA